MTAPRIPRRRPPVSRIVCEGLPLPWLGSGGDAVAAWCLTHVAVGIAVWFLFFDRF